MNKLTCKPYNNNNTSKITLYPKPFLKWVGGKTQIIDVLLKEFPSEINHYHEIFLGGGSVLFALLWSIKKGNIKIKGNIYAYDINEPLIYVYKNIQSTVNYKLVFQEIQKLITCYQCSASVYNKEEVNRAPKNIEEATKNKENYYYWIRSEYNKSSLSEKKTPIGSAMFIFLNKTCFRGLFRVGLNGFNVPFGNYLNPEIINKQHLDEIHDLIQNVVFECCDFRLSLKKNIDSSSSSSSSNNFIYLDPPYAPENATSFVKYNENGFPKESHLDLFNCIHDLTNANEKIIMSNADVSLVRENFTNDNDNSCINDNNNNDNDFKKKYNITSILCKRAINSKNPEAKAKEVIIKNYLFIQTSNDSK
jgi:DNA adenine methylase